MSVMALIAAHTHFTPEGTRGFRLYTEEKCDDCGLMVYPNGPTISAPKSGSVKLWLYDTKEWLLSAAVGLKLLPKDAILEGLYYRESDDTCCCETCCAKVKT